MCDIPTRDTKDTIRRYTNFITENPKQLHVSAAENLKINLCKGEISDIAFIIIYIYIYIHTHTHTQGVSGGIVNILGGGSMDYSE
jgi:hypothetical protein